MSQSKLTYQNYFKAVITLKGLTEILYNFNHISTFKQMLFLV